MKISLVLPFLCITDRKLPINSGVIQIHWYNNDVIQHFTYETLIIIISNRKPNRKMHWCTVPAPYLRTFFCKKICLWRSNIFSWVGVYIILRVYRFRKIVYNTSFRVHTRNIVCESVHYREINRWMYTHRGYMFIEDELYAMCTHSSAIL